ncbi:DUF551 domain-containing protein [Enterobacter hormaechei]
MLQGADGKSELTVWYGSMPESNGKANWTAILHRKGEGRCMDGFTIDRSEYPGRVLYAADRVRYLIGEKSERPSILDYDADAHSGYVKPGNSPVLPDGWVEVPKEPTPDMREAYHQAQAEYEDVDGLWSPDHQWKAMLATAPHFREIVNSSTNNFRENAETSTNGWIPCSEQIPEESTDADGGATCYLVLYADGKEPNGGSSVGVWNVTYLRHWWAGFITHWMPLPAAPQQEA